MVGLTWGPGDPYHPSLRWVSLLSHMLERQKIIGRDFAEDAVLCFDKLVLGRSHSLDWCGCRDLHAVSDTLVRKGWLLRSAVTRQRKPRAWRAQMEGSVPQVALHRAASMSYHRAAVWLSCPDAGHAELDACLIAGPWQRRTWPREDRR